MMAWEDGQRGVFRIDSSQEVKVSKKHELMDSDQPQLVDNLMSDMQQYYTNELMGSHTSRAVNEPSMSRASQLLGIGNLLCDGDDDERPLPTPAKSSAAMLVMKPPTPSLSGGPSPMEIEDSAPSTCLLDSLRPQQPQAKAKPAPKGASKAKAKPTPKSVPVAKCKAKAVPPVPAFDGDADAVADGGPASKKRRVARASEIEVMDSEVDGSSAAHLNESDSVWHTDFSNKFREAMHFAPREPDADFRADVADCVKSVNGLLTKVRARIRSVKRRTSENRDTAMNDAQELETKLMFYSSFLRNLQKPAGSVGFGDDLHSQVASLVEQDAIFGVEIVKRIAKCMVLDDIRFQRWPKLLDTTWPFIKKNTAPSESEAFFSQQVSVALQKLVKGIPLEKVRVMIGFRDHAI